MTDPRHARVMDIFLRASELDETKRAAYLDAACSDDETLRADVTSLLEHHQSRTILGKSNRLDVRSRTPAARGTSSSPAMGWRRELRRMPRSFWFSILFGIVTLLLAWWVREGIRNSLRDSLRQDLVTVLNADVKALRYWVEREKIVVKAWAEHPDLMRLTERLLAVSEAATDATRKEALLGAEEYASLKRELSPIRSDRGSVGVTVFGRDGMCLYHDQENIVGASIAPHGEPLLANILLRKSAMAKPSKGHLYVVGFDIRETGPVVGFAAPIGEQDGPVLGGLAIGYPDDEYTQALSVAQLGATGETYAFDRNYMLLSIPRDRQLLVEMGMLQEDEEAPLKIQVRVPSGPQAKDSESPEALPPPTEIAAKAVAEGRGVILDGYLNYRGENVIGAAQWLEDLDFGVCTEISYEEAFAPVRYVHWFTFILLSLIFLFAGSTALYSFLNVRLRRLLGSTRQVGPYTLIEQIGEGGMGKVFRAQHALLRRSIAIKTLDGLSVDRDTVARFEREVQLTSELTHPNTIQIYDYGRTEDDVFYFAMEYLLPGWDLSRVVKPGAPLPSARVVHILLQACGSLKEAHDRGLIHRDIKPANIMLCERGGLCDVVKVLDFGLVKSFVSQDAQLTQEGRIGGTPAYIAPERLSRQEVDGRSDIFSLGATAYFLLTGQIAFGGKSALETLHQILHTDPPRPSTLVDSDLPDQLEDLVMRCLAKSPQDRPAELSLMLSELHFLAEELPWRQDEARAWWEAFETHPTTTVFDVPS